MPSLAWLVSRQISLSYVIPTTFCLWTFIFLYLFFLHDWLCNCAADLDILLSLFSSCFSIYTLCLSALPVLAPAFLLAIQFFIRCFRQAKTHSFTDLNNYNIKKSHTPENNIPQQLLLSASGYFHWNMTETSCYHELKPHWSIQWLFIQLNLAHLSS